jgi:hypothetical protein
MNLPKENPVAKEDVKNVLSQFKDMPLIITGDFNRSDLELTSDLPNIFFNFNVTTGRVI